MDESDQKEELKHSEKASQTDEKKSKKQIKKEERKSYKSVRKELRRQKYRAYAIAVLVVLALYFVGSFLFRPFSSHLDVALIILYEIVYAALAFVGAYIAYTEYRRFLIIEAAAGISYNHKTKAYIRRQSDRFTKRLLNTIAIFFACFGMFVLAELVFLFFGNSKSAELEENLFANVAFVCIPAALCIKNYLLYRMYSRRIDRDEAEFKKHRMWVIILSAGYWVLSIIIAAVTSAFVRYPANMILIEGVVFFLILLVYDLTLRQQITDRNIVVNRRRAAFISVGLTIVVAVWFFSRDTWYTQSYINSTPVIDHQENKIEYDEDSGVYTITKGASDFKILHLTDIHLGGSLYSYSKDIKALRACYEELKYTKPDFVIVTGDLSFPLGIMSMSLNNSAPVGQFAAFMRNTGIPWAFTYGNHDTESLASTSKGELNEIFKSLSYKTSRNLLYPYKQPDITGRNNQLIEVRNSDGRLNTALFLIDSNAYTGEGINVYDYIHDDQVDWYASEVKRLNAEEGRTVDSMVFFHIPLQEYKTAYELYESGSDEVKYFFGSNDEKMIDKICCSDYPSKLFDTMKELGSTDAVFCGHDHYNNMSLEYQGIRLTYGMSIDYLAMPGIEYDVKQRGAELITLHQDSSWEIEQIPLSQIVNK